MRSFNEWKNKDSLKNITVTCRDNNGTLEKLLNRIKELGNTGHSFKVVVDPAEDGDDQFFWDGDGSDYIKDVKAEKPGLKMTLDDEGEPVDVVS